MKGKSRLFGPVFASLLAAIILMTCVPSALADVTYTEHATVTGSTGLFAIPGATWGEDLNPFPEDPTFFWNPDAPIIMEISFAHYDWGDHGSRDSMYIEIQRPPPALSFMVPVAWCTDTTESAELYRAVLHNFMVGPPYPAFPTVIPVLKPWQIRICKMGTTVILRWTVPLVIEEQTWYPMGPTTPVKQPAVTIPPGYVVLRGCGGPSSGGEPPAGYGYSSVYLKEYDACGFLFCPEWRRNAFICLNSRSDPGNTQLRFDATFTANLPNPT